MGVFLELVNLRLEQLARDDQRRFERELLRDGRGLPLLELELGWRKVFRGAEGGRH